MKIVAGFFGGLIIAIVGSIIVSLTFRWAPEGMDIVGSATFLLASFLIFWVAGIVIALLAKSAAKAWRRLLLTLAILSFLLPLSGVIYTMNFVATQVDSTEEYAAAATAGAVIGGGVVSGFLGFVGFFLGVVFLIIGLLVGRDKEIIYVQAPPRE